MRFTEMGLSLATSTSNTKRQSECLGILAWIKWNAGDYSTARLHAEESQRVAKISGDLFREARALRLESTCCAALGAYQDSIWLYERATALLALCGMSGGDLGQSIRISKADVHRSKSEYVDALSIHQQILEDVSMDRDPSNYALSVLNIAQIDVEIGVSKDHVQKDIHTAKSIFSNMQSQRSITYCDIIQATLDIREGDFMVAKSRLQKSLRYAWENEAEAVSYCLEGLCNLVHQDTSVPTTFTWPVTFLAHSLKLKRKLEIQKALQFLGDLYLVDSDRYTATSLFTLALNGFNQMDVHRSKAECMLRLGDISALHGDFVKAEEHWRTARPLFERSSQAKQIADIDERLAGIGLTFPVGPRNM
jgi:tetratricopeptide (TPR) repeat protein